MVGHLVVDVRVQCGRSGTRGEQLRLVEFEKRQSDLEKERTSFSAAGCGFLSGGSGLVCAIFDARG